MVRRAAILLVALLAVPAPGTASDVRAAVEAFVARASGVSLTSLVIEQDLAIYHPDGRRQQSGGGQRVLLRLPRQQRVEQTIDGKREVRLAVGDRVWVRAADGSVYEAPPVALARDRTHLLVPFRRSAADVLAEWRALGIRDGVSHVARVGGRSITVIGALPGDRQSPAVWLDPEFGVVRFITRETLPSGPALMDLAFSEHRPLAGGFFFPHRQEAFVDGKMVVLITVRSIAINPTLSDELFDPDALRRTR
ncbi:MAG TPA: hypothetical protein VMR23_18330 [Candidatus Limnocylindria bacterium]|nr:hypothetical protein [Candidatus Limnocylindria bacterium]